MKDINGIAITNFIPAGRENAVTRDVLRTLTGLSDRENRKLIELARLSGEIIINRQDGKGYYISDDPEDWEQQYRQDTSRALSILARRKAIRQRLKAAGRRV